MAKSVKLGDLLPDKLDSVAGQVRDRMCDDERIGGMKLAWDFIGKQLNQALKAALDCDLLDVLGKTWSEFGELAEFADPDKHPPGERSVVEIGQHEIARDLHPVIAVTIAPCPCVELKFLLALTAQIGGVRLSILDGHIVGGDLGELWASAQLSYEGLPLHPAQESAKVAIPSEFAFEQGIKIPRISSPPVEAAAAGG
ncbi:MAG: hypothetical protein H0V46_01130 [Sphingomonas sp.]|nr:hypothetical protein [Sphingomonas sp.]